MSSGSRMSLSHHSLCSPFTREHFAHVSMQDLAKVHNLLKSLFLLFPNYCLGRGLMDIAFNEYHNQYYLKTGK